MKLLLVLSVSLLFGCSSQTKNLNFEDKVLSRIDGLSERPDWFKESEAFKIANDKVISLGSTTLPADHRLEAGIRIAQSNAKAGICSAIEQRLEYLFQNAQEDTTMDTAQVRYIGAEACKLTSTSLRNDKIYWEKVLTLKNSGEQVVLYKVFATATMNESDLKAAILEAMTKKSGKNGLSKNFAESVEQHWDKFSKAQ